jgi:hypothetical protein
MKKLILRQVITLSGLLIFASLLVPPNVRFLRL